MEKSVSEQIEHYKTMGLHFNSLDTVIKIRRIASHLGKPVTVRETLDEGRVNVYHGTLIMVELTGFFEIWAKAPHQRYHLFNLDEENIEIIIEEKLGPKE